MIKTFRLEDMKHGWFVGDFEPTAYKTKNFEVNFRTHPKGQTWDVHTHCMSTEINLVVSGKMLFQNQELVSGDIFIVEPWEVSNPVFMEDTTIVCVRTPGVNDKIVLNTGA